MEEPLFRVTTTINRQSILESFWRGRKKNELRNMILGHIVFVIASYLFAELTIRPISNSLIAAITFYALSVGAAIHFAVTPYIVAFQTISYLRKRFGKEETYRLCEFYEDRMVWSNLDTKEVSTVPYACLYIMKETKNHYILFSDNQLDVFRVTKNGLVNGDANEFRVFLQAKLVNTVY